MTQPQMVGYQQYILVPLEQLDAATLQEIFGLDASQAAGLNLNYADGSNDAARSNSAQHIHKQHCAAGRD
jgi:hypothetical protein